MDCSLPGFSAHGIFQARILYFNTNNKKKKNLRKMIVMMVMMIVIFNAQFSASIWVISSYLTLPKFTVCEEV